MSSHNHVRGLLHRPGTLIDENPPEVTCIFDSLGDWYFARGCLRPSLCGKIPSERYSITVAAVLTTMFQLSLLGRSIQNQRAFAASEIRRRGFSVNQVPAPRPKCLNVGFRENSGSWPGGRPLANSSRIQYRCTCDPGELVELILRGLSLCLKGGAG